MAAVIQLVEKGGALAGFLSWSVMCFAAAVPTLVGSFLIELHRDRNIPRQATHVLFNLLGLASALFGVALLFFHLSLHAGLVFSVCSVLSVVAVVIALRPAV